MSFLIGKTQQHSNVNPAAEQSDVMLNHFLQQRGFSSGLFPGTYVDKAALQPYLDLFTQQNTRNLAQAKESAGNLTGSGFANILGARTAEANANQGAFLADLMERRRTGDQNAFIQALSLAMGSPAAGVTTTYRPGLLDYAAQAATGLAQGGAFNPLFKHTAPAATT